LEKRKKVYLFVYTRKNVGDDLFIYLLSQRYENIDFYINPRYPEVYNELFKNCKNINMINEIINMEKIICSDYDAFVYIRRIYIYGACRYSKWTK